MIAVRDAPKGRFLIGHFLEFSRRPLETMTTWQRRYGDLVRFRLGPRTFYLISHPDLAEEVLHRKSDTFVKVYDPRKPTGIALLLGNGLLTSTGETWRKHRRMIQPIFHRSHMVRMSQTMVDVGQRMLKRWEEQDRSLPVDMTVEMTQITLEIITQTMFSTSVLKDFHTFGPALRSLLRYVFKAFHRPFRLPTWVPTAANREFRRTKARLDQLVYGLIAERRRSGRRYGDLLDLLLQAVDEETGNRLTDEQIRDETVTIFSAGHDTTANALSWAWYLLATHPEVRSRLHKELTDVLDGRTPTADDLPKLPYTKAVFEETLRLYPPAAAMQRRAAVDSMLHGHRVPAGAVVVIGLYNLHRHRDFWEEPDRFVPERFTDGGSIRHRCAYLPFGGGPRSCVGNSFAMVEGPLLLALIAQRYDLRLVPSHPVESELAVTLRPRFGLPMTRHPR
jgi:cytochrome P450